MMMPYSAYKNSKLDWLGDIPSHWDLVKLGACFQERNEKVSDKDFAALSVTKNGILPQMEHVAKTDAGDNRKKVCIGDFVINSRSDRKGSSGTSDYDGSVSLISIILEPRLYEPRFAHHLLRSYNFQEEFYKYGKGIVADLWSTRYSDMKNIFVPLMPVDEQKAIATFLDRETLRIDSLIEEKQTFIKLLKEKRQALISYVVTKGLNPNVEMQDSGIEWIGQVPKHWEMIKFSHFVSIRNGQVDPTIEPWSNRILIAPNHIESGSGKIIKKETAAEQGADSGKYLCKKGEVIYSKIRPALAKACICEEDEAICSADMYPISCDSRMKNEYLLWLILSSEFTRYAILESERIAMPKINRDSLGKIKFPVPPITEQNAALNYIKTNTEKIERLIEHTNTSIELLQEHRISLISAAVTGKIDVREAV
ncbi:restriction endonuclease subunit S [Vibrio parahaemolyticus]|nr:restriction endonuclease subunit S [Vibrio parahaemolyticus]MBM5183663.1 restriction endonuclease subunit S [Vibrio parahaemolyticus]